MFTMTLKDDIKVVVYRCGRSTAYMIQTGYDLSKEDVRQIKAIAKATKF